MYLVLPAVWGRCWRNSLWELTRGLRAAREGLLTPDCKLARAEMYTFAARKQVDTV